MGYSVTIVENTKPAYVAEPVTDGDKVIEIFLEPVVAWKVTYESGKGNELSENATAIPVTIHSGIADRYAVYYSDTKAWSIPEDTAGNGINELKEHFQNSLNKYKDIQGN